MITSHLTKPEQIALLQALGRGALLHFSTTPVVIEEQTLTGKEVDARCEAFAALLINVNKARAALETALAAADKHDAETRAFTSAVAAVVEVAYGNSASILEDFGLTPKKQPATQSTTEKAAAVAKREATRQARHTIGPKAKLGIHGDVTGVTITPAVSPAEAPAEHAGSAEKAATTA